MISVPKRMIAAAGGALLVTAGLIGSQIHTHRPGPEAACTEPQVCLVCGEILEEAKGHTPGPAATCTGQRVCLVCGEVLAEAKGHTPGPEATCTEPQVCLVCGAVLAEAKGHAPGPEATCTEPQICSVCGAVLAEARGHAFVIKGEARACAVCGYSEKIAGSAAAEPAGTADPAGTAGTAGTAETPRQVAAEPVTAPQTVELCDETASGVHYHNTINAYYSGNVLVCGDYALEYFSSNSSGSGSYASILTDFAAKYPSVRVASLLVPKSCAFNAPSGYANTYDSQSAFIENTYSMMSGVVTVDAAGLMKRHSGEYLYYRTDHHWTSLGAYYASAAMCDALGITPREISDYATVVNTGFIGTLYGYTAEPHPACLLANPDYTVGHYPKTTYSMTYYSGGEAYSGSAINGGAKSYASMFVCGDQPLTVIRTENHNGRKLLIFKESYGNAFVPYMIDYFEEIVVVDIRKSCKGTGKLIGEYGITDAVIVNNVQAAVSLQSSLREKLAS
ncbi:MAG TPA: DHHW family protein [Oscillospiraceae bacterium]|nr:DHHW family protein [Oscillospiraceae bacterium]